MKKICSISKLNKTVRTGGVSQQLLKDIDLKDRPAPADSGGGDAQ